MPKIAAKEVQKQVTACACPDAHKGQFAAALNGLDGLNLGRLGLIIQTVEQYAVKYGPQIWADVQILLALFGGNTPAPPAPPGPTPAQDVTANPRGLLTARRGSVALLVLVILCLVAVLALFVAPAAARADTLPQTTMPLPQTTLCPPGCPCGPDCQCGETCRCGEKTPCGVSLADDAVYAALLPEEAAGPPLPQTTAAAPAAAPAPTTFHLEQRVRCGTFGCRPYAVLVPDQPAAARLTTAGPAGCPACPAPPAAVCGPNQSCLPPPAACQSYAGGCVSCSAGTSDAAGGATVTGRKGLFRRFREWRAARRSGRGRGCSGCGG